MPKNPDAFPLPEAFNSLGMSYEGSPGMSLRDYFAAQALPAIVTALGGLSSPDNIAEGCYMMADAMLAERGNS